MDTQETLTANRSTRILGISAYYHDSAAALLDMAQIVAAAQEERFPAKNTTRGFRNTASSKWATIELTDVDQVVFYDCTSSKH